MKIRDIATVRVGVPNYTKAHRSVCIPSDGVLKAGAVSDTNMGACTVYVGQNFE